LKTTQQLEVKKQRPAAGAWGRRHEKPITAIEIIRSTSEQTNKMKSKLATLILIGLVSCSLASAQTDTANDNAAIEQSTNNPAATAGTETATNLEPAASPAPADAAPPAAVATPEAQPAPAIPAPAEPEHTVYAAPPTANPPEGEVIPLIQFQDVQLTTAIENLARQANINYILDPKVGFGQPDERTGAVRTQPSITLRWEKVTAGQALMTLLQNNGLQLVENPKTKISRVTVKDPAAAEPLVTRVIQLKYAGPSNILASVQSTLTDKRSKVVPDIRTSQLVVLATEKEMAGVEELLKQLDLPTKQVLIEAKILETTVNPKTVKGIDWSGTLSKQNVSFGNGFTSGKTTTTTPGTPVTTTTTLPSGRVITSTTTPRSSSQTVLDTVLGNGGVSLNTLSGFSPHTAFLNADGLNVALSFLNNSADTKTISEPRMVTLDNQKATIDVGLMYPIVNVQAGTANTSGGSQISYSNLTVTLDVTPRITANDFVEMRVMQSILRLGPKFASTVGNLKNDVDSFFTRRLETAVLIPSGNTLVMGGLISDESLTSNAKVPLLGDIPVLGLAFRRDSKERNRQNLIIFITPTIVQDSDFQPAHSKFLQSTGKEGAREEWSAWDSGKPHDWSKPKAAPNEETILSESAVAPKESATPEASATPDLKTPHQP
jgi:type II secretory pathway component GspD/PulD (secretin)